ncbi:MAG: NUDIX domain-containing protein [Nitrospirae bacterium]|nr:NUDIX domain-containing protein [Nitrospirota bacterium]
MSEELLDVVDEDGRTIKTLARTRIHGNPSLMHKVVHALVFDKDNRLILQKRSMNKDVAPGRWDTSVGGHVNAGESIDEALSREMEEELGITSCSPEFLYTYIHSNPYETELVYTFSCIYDGKIKFQHDEIDEVRSWSLDDIRSSIGKGIFSDNFEHEIRMYLKNKLYLKI